MPKFRFQLEPVLDQRRAVEQSKQQVVAELQRHAMRIENEIRDLQDQLVRGREDLREHLRGAQAGVPVDLRGARRQASSSLGLVARAQQAVIQLAGVHARLDAARVELLRATTRRRAVEVLKERRYEAWKTEENRRETATLDEVAVLNAARREEFA